MLFIFEVEIDGQPQNIAYEANSAFDAAAHMQQQFPWTTFILKAVR